MIFPRNDLKKQEILQKIMKDFNENKSYTEEEVGNVIRKHFDEQLRNKLGDERRKLVEQIEKKVKLGV